MTYQPIHTLHDRHVDQLLDLYRQEWWSATRQKPDVTRMLAESDYIFGWVDPAVDQLVAFCRVLSDRVYRAIVFDVIVSPAHRGQGLGHSLLNQVVQHPELAQLECIQLFCKPEMVPFYQRLGFQCFGQLELMTRVRADLESEVDRQELRA